MTGWRESTLGEIITVKHGYPFKGEFFADTGEEIVLTPGNFPVGGGLQFREGKERYYVGPYPSEFRLTPGQLLVVMTDLRQDAPILGSPAFVPDYPLTLHNQRLGLVTVRPEAAIDIQFLYYLLLSDATRSQLRATATGSTVRHTAPERIYKVRVTLPPLEIQRSIGSVLSSIDDLVLNSRQRVERLEQMARAIYQEWFIHLRYPGYGHDVLLDSPLGPLPQGWEVTRLDDRFDVVLGGTPSRSNPEYWTDGTIPWINSGRVNNTRVIEPSEWITAEALRRSNTKLLPRRTTVIAITGATLCQVSLLEIEASTNQSVIGIVDRDGEISEFLYLAICDQIDSIIAKASGGAQQHINKSIVASTQIVLPSTALREKVTAIMRPTFDHMALLLRNIARLADVRSFLLPRLIAGQIDVSELNIDTLVDSVA